MSRRRREAARKAAAHRSLAKVHVTERVLGRKAKKEAAQTAVAPPAPQGGPQMTTLSSSAVINDRDLGPTGEPSRAPVSSAATVESGRTAPRNRVDISRDQSVTKGV